ncbi:hypothetical protein JL721_8807 [Aureococcus anophagefferens]|nr:hypothetical protein JL721_8807 [Aureococcus anophagefferens]
MFNAADQLDVGDDAERKREKEAERQRIEELTELYAYTLAKAEAEGNVDDWSELKSRRPASWSDSFYEFLGLQEKDDVPKPKEPTPEELEHETERVKLASKHWVNYDIRESLAPSLISEEEFDAAVKIGNLIRNFNARRAAARRRIGGEEEKQRNFEEEKEWKAYEDFRTTLLNKGYTLSRWSHSKKILVPCTIRIDGSREYLVLSQNRFKSKQRRLKDIHTITRGYNSPFLRDLLQHKSPEKVLSLLLRNRAKGGKEESIDLMFELPGSGAKAGADASLASDGKFLRNKFFANFTKLQHELESDDAFFFNTDGVYCQVGRSVFDRWEQVTLIDPNWDKEIDEDERRVRLKRKYNERARKKAAKHVPYQYEPHPLPEGSKPQDDMTFVYEATVEPEDAASDDDDRGHDGPRRGSDARDGFDATTWLRELDESNREGNRLRDRAASTTRRHVVLETVSIEYGEFLRARAKKKKGHEHEEIITAYEKEVFTLQAVGRSDRDGPPHPLFGRHRPGQRKFKENEPIPAPLEQLKPYFEKELKEVYGDIGVGGWRNRDDGSFELAEDEWRKLCKICDQGTKDQKTTGRKLVAAFNPELDKRRGSKGGDDDDAPPRDKGTVDEAKLGKLKVAVLNKKKLETEKILLAREAMARNEQLAQEAAAAEAKEKKLLGGKEDEDKEEGSDEERELAEAELEKEIEEELQEEGLGTEVGDGGEDTKEGDDDDDDEGDDDGGAGGDFKGAPTPAFEVVVLEISKKRQPPIALGLTVEKVDKLAGSRMFFRGKKGRRQAPHCALVLLDVDEDAPASISNAYQNEILRVGDYIVGVNGVYPKKIDALIQGTEKSQKRRVLNILRPKSARDDVDDELEKDTITI